MQKLIINGREVDLDAIAKATEGSAKAAATKERRETFRGNVLTISDLYAYVDIQTSQRNEITVSVTGPENIVDQLLIREKGGVVTVEGRGGKGTSIIQCGGINITGNVYGGIVGGSGNNVTVISGDSISINTSGADAKLTIRITAPIRTEINLSGVSGDTTIGDLRGDINLDMSGQSFVHALSVQDLDLDSSGNCEVVVEKITGNANLDLSGSCKVELRSGSIDKLTIDASGHCTVDAQVRAQRAKLEASGISSIFVKEVTDRCRKDRSGMSSIIIGGGINNLGIKKLSNAAGFWTGGIFLQKCFVWFCLT